MKKKALFPGSFDPLTLGHVDLIRRAEKICDELYVGIASHPAKKEVFSVEEREGMLKTVCKNFPYVKIVRVPSLAVDFAKEHQIDFLLRGLRAFSDFEMEFRMALANRKLSGIETVFLMADEKLSHVSSSLIRELSSFKHRLHDFVPAEIEEKIYKRLSI